MLDFKIGVHQHEESFPERSSIGSNTTYFGFELGKCITRSQNKQADKNETTWLTKHALRTLLKEDHAGALQLLGYAKKPQFDLTAGQASSTVKVGDDFVWQCALHSKAKQKAKVTLKLHFLKANGTHSAKVFAVKDGVFDKEETLSINKRQSFKPITTRTLYPGTHHAELIINGKVVSSASFELVV